MIISFAIENFLSIKNKVKMLLTPNKKYGDSHVLKNPVIDVLQMSSIFGPNGSGKTNLLLAINFIQKMIVGNTENMEYCYTSERDESKISGDVHCIYNNDVVSKFEIIVNVSVVLKYCFNYDSVNKKVTFERLSLLNDGNKVIFERNENEIMTNCISNSSKIKIDELYIYTLTLDHNDNLNDDNNTKKYAAAINKLFKTMCITSYDYKKYSLTEENNYEIKYIPQYNISKDSFDTISRILFNLTDIDCIKLIKTKNNSSEVNNVNSNTNIGTLNISNNGILQFMMNNKEIIYDIKFIHKTRNQFDFIEESTGIQRLIQILFSISSQYISNSDFHVIVIDEMCYSFHKSIAYKLLENLCIEFPKCQFIFSMHESELIDNYFRPDEIWFMDRTNTNVTLYSLNDYDIKYHQNPRISYLNGRYGAIPKFV